MEVPPTAGAAAAAAAAVTASARTGGNDSDSAALLWKLRANATTAAPPATVSHPSGRAATGAASSITDASPLSSSVSMSVTSRKPSKLSTAANVNDNNSSNGGANTSNSETKDSSNGPRRGPGRPRKSESNAKLAAKWDDAVTTLLLRFRYDTMAGDFDSVRNNVEVGECWIALANELSQRSGKSFDSHQCQSKLRNLKKTWRELSNSANSAAAKTYALFPVLQQYLGRDTGPVYFSTKSEIRTSASSNNNDTDASSATAAGLATSRPTVVRADAAQDASRSVRPSSSDASVTSDAESVKAQTSNGAVSTNRPSQRTDSARANDVIAVESSASDSEDAAAPHFATPLTGRTRARSDSVSSSSSSSMVTPPPRKRLSKSSFLSRVSPVIAATVDAVATERATPALDATADQGGADRDTAVATSASDASAATATEPLSSTATATASTATSTVASATPAVPVPSASEPSTHSSQSTGAQSSDGGIDASLLSVASGLRALMDGVVASREAASEQELLRAEMRDHSATMKALSEQVRKQTAALERLTELLGATFNDA